MAGDAGKTRLAAEGDWAAIATALARAFHDDPFMAFALPDERTRLEIGQAMFLAQLDVVFSQTAEVYTTPDLAGAAVWTPPDPPALAADRTEEIRRRMRALFGERVAVIGEAFRVIMRNRPDGQQWYLEFLGTDPEHQRQGVASSLLTPALERGDANGVPATLWTATEANVRFYAKRGFEVTADVQPPGAPRVWWMRRLPRRT